jgi:predicted negative regulator of RcsB-dependent stress response
MKAEHRKELQTNTLQASLKQTFEGIKQGPSRNTVVILVLVALGALLFFTWRYFSTSAAASDSTRWRQWSELTTTEQAQAFADSEDARGTVQARLTRFKLARYQLENGITDLGAGLPGAEERIRKAASEYEALIDSAKAPLLQQEAILNAGKGREALGELDEAKSHYDRLVNAFPDSPAGKIAKERLAQFEKDKDDIQKLDKKLLPTTGG